MKLGTDYIEKLVKILTTNGLTELSIDDGESAITLKKDANVVAVATPSVQQPVVSSVPEVVVELKEEDSTKPANKGKAIVSPMVGTFYGSASPESEPFVEIGKTVNEGDVVCIIEAMKLMNEIKTEFSGKITQICVQNGDPIEYGQVLMYVE